MSDYKSNAEQYVREKCQLDHIGWVENIALQHWLRVLRHAYTDRNDEHHNVAITGSGEVLFERHNSTHKGTGWVYLSSETDGYRMQFNLTTGQPATDEDYKAFCEIVGVE